MQVTVLGATGFIGRHVVSELVNRGHSVIGVHWTSPPNIVFPEAVELVSKNLYEPFEAEEVARDSEAIIDLVWPGLPNYSEIFHLETNLPQSYRMLKNFAEAGYQQIFSAGTCLEYGMQSGALPADRNTDPTTPYSVAKDTLRRSLELLAEKTMFRLQWARLFYVYGPGQNSNSLLPMLDSALEKGKPVFNMSGGEQLRDFIPVHEAAKQIVRLIENAQLVGVFNICTGTPMSVRTLVEEHLRKSNKQIELNLGFYPYPRHEPLAFWGIPHDELRG